MSYVVNNYTNYPKYTNYSSITWLNPHTDQTIQHGHHIRPLSLEERTRVRAYYMWLNGSRKDAVGNYYEALHLELNRFDNQYDIRSRGLTIAMQAMSTASRLLDQRNNCIYD